MSKKTTIEDAIAMLGFATTPEEKVRTQGTKKEMIGPKGTLKSDFSRLHSK